MVFLIFISGLLIGSFLDVIIYRLKNGGRASQGRSYCPRCKKTLRWFELVPLVSFALQAGRCRGCQQKIDWQYPLVEFATGLLFALAFIIHLDITSYGLRVTDYLILLRDWFFISVLVVVFVYDLRWQIIPDKITLPAMAGTFLLGLGVFLASGQQDWTRFLLQDFLAAALVGGGFFLAQFLLSRGRWIGGGDIRLGALMGLMLGLPTIIWAIMLSYILGAVVAIGLIITGRKTWRQAVPFGTFLSLGTIAMLFWSREIVAWYISLF